MKKISATFALALLVAIDIAAVMTVCPQQALACSDGW
jgi:hypothetical protein